MPQIFISQPFSDAALLAALGLGAAPARAAALHGQALVAGPDPSVPWRAPSAGGRIAGMLVSVDDDAVAALRFLADCLGWSLDRHPVTDATGQTEAPALLPPEGEGGEAAFAAEAHAGRWHRVWQRALPELLSYRGRFTPAEVGWRRRQILSRAHSRAMAEAHHRVPESGLDRADLDIRLVERPYSEFFAVDEYYLTHRRFDGGTSDEVRRAVFVAADAVTVLPYDPQRDRVLLVEQFRAAPLGRGDPSPWLLEPVAGRIEPGDTPEQTARKEASEEAGLRLGALHKVAEYYPSTGCFSEYVTSYVGIADLPDEASGLHGVAEENEDIRGHILSREVFFDRILAGDMPDAPLILTAYWLQANLGRLRGLG